MKQLMVFENQHIVKSSIYSIKLLYAIPYHEIERMSNSHFGFW